MTTSSFRIVRCAAIMVALGLTMTFLAQESSAQSCGYGGYGYGNGGRGISINYNVGRSYYNTGVNRNLYNGIYHPQSPIRTSYNSYRSSYRLPAHTWHDTSHWDYIPGRYVPHGNHLDYIPGRRVWHRSGHVDHNHR